jgi:hypothetical protein
MKAPIYTSADSVALGKDHMRYMIEVNQVLRAGTHKLNHGELLKFAARASGLALVARPVRCAAFRSRCCDFRPAISHIGAQHGRIRR